MKSLNPEDSLDSALQAAKIRLIMQLRRNGIQDTRVLGAIEQTPREFFVSPAFIDQSYEDRALPIECDQTISQPTIVALMTQELKLTDRMTVLEVGTGSGYQTILLSRLARRVHTIERHQPLYHLAASRFEALRLRNIITHLSDGMLGWPHAAPYDRIMVTAAAFEDVPHALLSQLSDEGIMIIPIAESPVSQTLYRIHKEGQTYVKTALCKVQFVPLLEGVEAA